MLPRGVVRPRVSWGASGCAEMGGATGTVGCALAIVLTDSRLAQRIPTQITLLFFIATSLRLAKGVIEIAAGLIFYTLGFLGGSEGVSMTTEEVEVPRRQFHEQTYRLQL